MKFQKKYIVIASLVLALGTAVYVNWQMSGAQLQTTSKQLGAATYVNATVSASSEDEAVETMSLTNEQKNYFANERTKRQETQDSVLDEANEAFELENASEEDISEAQKSVEKILKNFTIQDSIESIIKAKGFSDCLCYISDEGVTVIVPEAELNDTSVLVINDSVVSHYEVSFEDISVVGV